MERQVYITPPSCHPSANFLSHLYLTSHMQAFNPTMMCCFNHITMGSRIGQMTQNNAPTPVTKVLLGSSKAFQHSRFFPYTNTRFGWPSKSKDILTASAKGRVRPKSRLTMVETEKFGRIFVAFVFVVFNVFYWLTAYIGR